MKKRLPIIITLLLTVSITNAQTDETLTNGAIVKMSNAKLSNELIIEVIQSSTVLFDLSASAIKKLETEKVSSQVIEAMKSANGIKTEKAPVIQPVAAKKKDEVPTEIKIEALNYVRPLKELVTFYQNEAKLIDGTINGWDNTIRNAISEVNKLNEQILQLESDLREKKNADSKGYSSEIISMKKKLAEYRANYKELKSKFLAEGGTITKKLAEMSSENSRSISKKYDEVCQLIKSTDADPSTGEKVVSITITGMNINENTSHYISPSTEMLNWHRNEINELQKLVEKWNPKVKEIIRKDAELNKKLKPITNKLEEYKSDSKKYKTEIASLKKQRDEIEKERKQLADQMENESRELADYLKKLSTEIQNSLKERYADIIENINYSYQEKLNL